MSLEDKLYPFLSLYDRLPQGARNTIGSIYRLMPRRIRYGKAYGEFRSLAEDSPEWSTPEINEYQLRELRRTLINAASYCPYYQRTFAKAGFDPSLLSSPDELVNCPFLNKEDIQKNLNGITSANIPESQKLYITTGGSTGVPVGFHLQKGISRPKEQAFMEANWRRIGYFDKARLALIRGHVTDSQSSGKIISYDATRNWLLLSSSHLTDERMPEYISELEKFNPDFLYVYPSSALQIAEFLERHNQTWRVPLQGIFSGSEQLTISQKRMLESVFHCRIIRWYGHSERAALAAEGTHSDLYYFWPHYGFVEFGEKNDDGLSEVIATTFDNLAMPLVRYRTGDYVRQTKPDTKREFLWPAVEEISGREQEFLITATGRRISLTTFNMHDSIFDGLYAVQFFQSEPGIAEFRYIPSSEFHLSRLDTIKSGIMRKLGDDFQLVIREVDEVEKTSRGKHTWLINRL